MTEHHIRLGQKVYDLFDHAATVIDIDRVRSDGWLKIRFNGTRYGVPTSSLIFTPRGKVYFDNSDLDSGRA